MKNKKSGFPIKSIKPFLAGFETAREMAAQLQALDYEPFAESFRQLGEEEVTPKASKSGQK